MSGDLWAMGTGTLARDPERRASQKAEFIVATVRIGDGDAVQWISVIAFGDAAERLLGLKRGDALSVAGRLELRTWRGQEGGERTGLSIVASEIAAARPKPRRRDGAPRSPRPRPAYRPGAELPTLDDPISGLRRGDDPWDAP